MRKLLLLLLLLPFLWAKAQQPSTTFFHLYTVKDGLTDNHIRKVFKDSRGFIWIATTNGLNRFDGYTFQKFYHNPNDSASLPGNNIVSITEDKQGRILFSLHGGVAAYDYRTGKFRKLNLAFEKGFDKPGNIMCDNKGRLWIASWLGHYVFDSSDRLIKHWRQGKGPNAFPHGHSDFTYEDSHGRIWIGSGGGLCLLNEATMDFKVYKVDKLAYTKNNGWRDDIGIICEDNSGQLWTTGWANGLRSFNPSTGHFEGYLPTPEFAGEGAFNIISGLAFFDGHLWVNSDKGLCVFDTVQKKFFFLADLGFNGYPMPLERTTSLNVTGDILWVGTKGGLYKLDLRDQYFEMHKVRGLVHGSCLPQINSLAIRPESKKQIIFPTWTCGAFEYNLETRVLKPYLDFGYARDTRRYDFKKAFFDSHRVLWIPSSHGLLRIDSNKKVEHIRPVGDKPGMPAENYFYQLVEDRQGNIWAGSGDGILFFKGGGQSYIKLTLDSIDKQHNEVSDNIEDISVAANGDIWFLRGEGYTGGKVGFSVYRYSANTFETYTATVGAFKNYPFTYVATSILADNAGNVWVTSPRGLIQFKSNDFSKFRLYTVIDGLASDNCHSIIQDTEGFLWVACSGGLSRISPGNHEIRNFTTTDGLPPGPINSITAGEAGEIFIGCEMEWLLVYKPRTFKVATTEKVKLVSASLDGTGVPLSDTLSANYNFNYLKLNYSPLNYLLPKDNTYEIEIAHDGHLTKYPAKSNELMLSGLEPGRHDIKIACKTPGNDAIAPALFTVNIIPAFWQTWWFKTLLLLLIVLVAGWVIVSRFRRLKKEEEQQRILNNKIAAAEMNALRSQMNPHFIFNALNAVHRFIWEKKPTEASEYLTKFSRLTRLVLEYSRKQNVRLSEDITVLQYYLDLEGLNLEYGLEYKIEVADEIDPEMTMIPPMILQPLVENSLKHGLRSLKVKGLINITVKAEGRNLVCAIMDNGVGRGFAGTRVTHTSLSTQIIKDRLDVINNIYNSNSRYVYTDLKNNDGTPAGTLVELYLPLITDN